MWRQGGEVRRRGVAQRVAVATDWAQVVPHSCMVDKSREGYLGSKWSQPQAGSHSPGFQRQAEDISP